MPGTNDGYDSQYACPSSLSDSPGLRHRIAAWHLLALRLHTSYNIGYIPIPNIGNDILFLSFKFARLIYTELVVGRTSGCLITPFHIITFHCYNQITVWCSTAVDMACPPGSTRSPDIMLIDSGSRQCIFIIMCMP